MASARCKHMVANCAHHAHSPVLFTVFMLRIIDEVKHCSINSGCFHCMPEASCAIALVVPIEPEFLERPAPLLSEMQPPGDSKYGKDQRLWSRIHLCGRKTPMSPMLGASNCRLSRRLSCYIAQENSGPRQAFQHVPVACPFTMLPATMQCIVVPGCHHSSRHERQLRRWWPLGRRFRLSGSSDLSSAAGFGFCNSYLEAKQACVTLRHSTLSSAESHPTCPLRTGDLIVSNRGGGISGSETSPLLTSRHLGFSSGLFVLL